MTTEVLGSTDRKIVSVLQAEGRISNLDLAERVGLSPTPCNRRVKRLEDIGVITGYGVRVNQSALGIGVSVKVNVRLSEQDPLDYVLKVRAVDVEALKDFVLEKLKTIPCVSETTTMLILETVKSID